MSTILPNITYYYLVTAMTNQMINNKLQIGHMTAGLVEGERITND
jgi:hypothetical protein